MYICPICHTRNAEYKKSDCRAALYKNEFEIYYCHKCNKKYKIQRKERWKNNINKQYLIIK